MAQIQLAQQASVGSAPSSRQEQAGLRTAKVFDLRHLKYTIFDDTPRKYDDWAFSFKRAIRSANCDAYKLLTRVERETDDVVRVWHGRGVRRCAHGMRFRTDARLVVSSVHGRRIVLHSCGLTVCAG